MREADGRLTTANTILSEEREFQKSRDLEAAVNVRLAPIVRMNVDHVEILEQLAEYQADQCQALRFHQKIELVELDDHDPETLKDGPACIEDDRVFRTLNIHLQQEVADTRRILYHPVFKAGEDFVFTRSEILLLEVEQLVMHRRGVDGVVRQEARDPPARQVEFEVGHF